MRFVILLVNEYDHDDDDDDNVRQLNISEWMTMDKPCVAGE